MKKVTVLTPTYNRAELLQHCYESLQSQNCYDFEWLIIDDGSYDNTEGVVSKWIKEHHEFPIRYIKKENGGKHTALNVGFKEANSKYTIILDSDDSLTNTAVNTVIQMWTEYDTNPNIGCVCFLKGTYNGEMVGKPFEKDGIISTRFEQKQVGDKAEVFRTEILRNYEFPVFEGERFIGEGYVWNEISSRYKFVFKNIVIYKCQYLDSGLTRSGRSMFIKNPLGGMAFNNKMMTYPVGFLRKMKAGMLYDTYGYFAKKSPLQFIKSSKNKCLTTLLCIPSFLLYLHWKTKYK